MHSTSSKISIEKPIPAPAPTPNDGHSITVLEDERGLVVISGATGVLVPG